MNIAIKILGVSSFSEFRLGSVNVCCGYGRNTENECNMLISLSNNIAILAMTKTGTTSVEAALAPHCEIAMSGAPSVKHIQFRKFDRFVRPFLSSVGHDSVETACVMRDPIDWLMSWYRYRQRPEITGKPNSTSGINVNQFVDAYVSDDPPSFANVGRPSRFVENAEGAVGVDHLFRYDQFDRYVGFLSERFGRRLDIERLNVSPKIPANMEPETRRRLTSFFARDYEIYEAIAQA